LYICGPIRAAEQILALGIWSIRYTASNRFRYYYAFLAGVLVGEE